jgi:hypothetical protein
VGPNNGGIDHHVFVIVITRQQFENALENSALCPPAEALIDHLPISETLRQIARVPIQDRIDEQSIVGRGASDMALASGQKVLDPIPLIVA